MFLQEKIILFDWFKCKLHGVRAITVNLVISNYVFKKVLPLLPEMN